MPVRNLGYWNELISIFHQNGDTVESFQRIERMLMEGVVIDLIKHSKKKKH